MDNNQENVGGGYLHQVQEAMSQQLARLSDTNFDIDKEIKRANAMNGICTTMINSAKVQVDYARLKLAERKADMLPEGSAGKGKQLENGK